jgi:hypothetical protein
MNETNQVVARFLNGRMLKGTTRDFFPNRTSFHVLAIGSQAPEEILCKDLKALFFVRDFSGNPEHRDFQRFAGGPAEASQGKKIAVHFKDGEFVCGYTLAFRAERDGFFILPADPKSNNLRLYILAHATREVRVGDEAEAMVQRLRKSRAA